MKTGNQKVLAMCRHENLEHIEEALSPGVGTRLFRELWPNGITEGSPEDSLMVSIDWYLWMQLLTDEERQEYASYEGDLVLEDYLT